jgi:hypothetical protein
VAVSYLEYRVVGRIIEPASELPAIQRAQAMIEDAPYQCGAPLRIVDSASE